MAGHQAYMAKSQVQFTKDNEYYTPYEFVSSFGKFDYDPATTEEKAWEFGLEHFDTIETNGLIQDWTPYKRIWINPPFTIKHEFLKKAWETYKIAKNDIYILFPIEFITTARFHNSVGGGQAICSKWENKFPKWFREERKISSIWKCSYEDTRCLGSGVN